MTPDPAGLAAVDASNPQSWNRYAYVLNNPVSQIDPLGLDCIYLWGDDSWTVANGDCNSETDDGYYVPGQITGVGTNDGQVTGVTLDGGNDVWPVGFDYNSSSSSSSDSSGGFFSFVPFSNPLADQLSAFANGPVGRTIQNGVNLLGCTSDAVLDEIRLSGFLGAHSPDPLGNKLGSPGRVISPNPDAKTLGLIPNNLASNTKFVVNTLDKLGD